MALNPIIKFSTLFGLLAVEIAVHIHQECERTHQFNYLPAVGAVLLAVALVFVWRSFYAMRIPKEEAVLPDTVHASQAEPVSHE